MLATVTNTQCIIVNREMESEVILIIGKQFLARGMWPLYLYSTSVKIGQSHASGTSMKQLAYIKKTMPSTKISIE